MAFHRCGGVLKEGRVFIAYDPANSTAGEWVDGLICAKCDDTLISRDAAVRIKPPTPPPAEGALLVDFCATCGGKCRGHALIPAEGATDPVRVTQRENGCYAACIASLTNIPRDDIPHPTEDDFSREAWTAYRNTLNRFLRERGWWRAWIPADTPPDGLAIAHGDGPRGMGHCCVSRGAEIVMDPHSDGGGLVSIEGYEVLIRCAALAARAPGGKGT